MTLPSAEFLSSLANLVLIAGSFIIFAATCAVVASGNVKERAFKTEIARLSTEADQAKARTAEAELRIKQLEPRNLNWSAFVEALRSAPRSNVEVLYFADDFDSMALAQQIALAIKEAGWDEPFRGPIKRPLDWSESTPMAVDGQPTGVTVVARLGPEDQAAIMSGKMSPEDADPTTPFAAIRRAVSLGTGRVSTWTNGPHAPPFGTIRIVVAPRE
jgi:hypothetical protein